MTPQPVFGNVHLHIYITGRSSNGHLSPHTQTPTPWSIAVGVSGDQGWGLVGEVAAGVSSNKQNLALTLYTHT